MQVHIDIKNNINVDNLGFENVERKGIGHPDTICDAIAEAASRRYSRYCIERFGRIAHHWFDKTILIGGESEIGFGVGAITQPYTMIFAGKVSNAVGVDKIPVDTILFEACVEVLSACLTGFNADKHLRIENRLVDYQGAGRKESRYRPPSRDALPNLEEFSSFTSNDCNLVSGYAPFSKLENVVMQLETWVNSREFKAIHPYTGWDVKVFGMRERDVYSLALNIPFLGQQVRSQEHYMELRSALEHGLTGKAQEILPGQTVELTVNPQDRRGKPYITAIGSAADTGDVGLVGRGNRLNGLITPMRPMSIEAPAGKNPIDHTGKIYGLLAHKLAWDLHREFKQAFEVHIFTLKESLLIDPDKILVNCEKITPEIEAGIKRMAQHAVTNVHQVIKAFVVEGATLW